MQNDPLFGALVESVGGEVAGNGSFRLPVADMAKAEAKFKSLGMELKTLGEYTDRSPKNGNMRSVAVVTAELAKPKEREDSGLMGKLF